MDKKLVIVLLVEAAIGIAITAWVYFWVEAQPPCQEMGCLIDFPKAYTLGVALITGFVLLLTIAVSSIGNSLRKK